MVFFQTHMMNYTRKSNVMINEFRKHRYVFRFFLHVLLMLFGLFLQKKILQKKILIYILK